MVVTKNFEKLEHSAVKLTITVKKEDTDAEYKNLIKDYSKKAKVDGYRPGKVPSSVLERKYGESLKMETMGQVMDKAVESALENETLVPLAYSQPSLEGEPKFNLGEDFSFTVKYDVFPEVTTGDIAGSEYTLPECTVTKEDEEKELEDIRQRNSLVTDKAEGAKAEKGNMATISYWELDDNNTEVPNSKREGFAFEIGSGNNIYGLDEDILDMVCNTEKVVTKTYDKDYKYPELAGTTKKVGIKLEKLKEVQLPALDDDLAQDVSEKFKTLDDLKADIKMRLTKTVEDRLKELKEKEIIDLIISKSSVDLPNSMVEAELEMRLRNLMQRMGITDVNQFLQILASGGKSVEQFKDEWRADTEKSIKTRLYLDKMIADGKYESSDDEVKAEISRIAKESNISEEEVKAEYENRGMMDYLKDRIKEDKLFADLDKKVTAKKGEKKSMSLLFKNEE